MYAKAVSPGHITGFFKIFPQGSTGAGVNIEKGMKTIVRINQTQKANIEIKINGKKSQAPVSKKVVEKYLKLISKNKKLQAKIGKKKNPSKNKQNKNFSVKIFHKTKFPIGYGMGISGAGALSLSLALNKAFRLDRKYSKCLEIAKEAEIECGTGLGDVVAESFDKGVMFGKKPYPSKKAEEIKTKINHVVMGFFGEIETKKIIRNQKWKKKINLSGEECMKEINNEPLLTNFIQLSRKFTFHTGLANKKILQVMIAIPNASMAMLGQTVFVLSDKPKETAKLLKKFTKRVQIAKISKQKARVL